jgi:hypothetical protein
MRSEEAEGLGASAPIESHAAHRLGTTRDSIILVDIL